MVAHIQDAVLLHRHSGGSGEVFIHGVDVAVDEYIGELIAVARRRDDPETVWIIAPENISYTIQQIEEMIYFEEQYYDSFVEIVDEELWDAYDENEKLLGFDLKRSLPQPDLLQGAEPFDDPFAGGVFLLLAEEGDRVVHRHLQYVVDRLFAVADFENFIFEALASAGFAH